MEGFNVYKDIQDRTNGEIYIGVVGPVRTGKSTFIKKFMDTVVIPTSQTASSGNARLMSCPSPQLGARL